MLVLIDESGDAGFRLGSSSHFVISMVIFDSFDDAEQAARMIVNCHESIGSTREFHFNKCDKRKRDAFFDAIKPAKFKIRLFVVEKRSIHSHFLKQNKEGFINYCLKMMMKFDHGRLKQAHVKIDGSISRLFKRACKSYLLRELESDCVKKLSFHDSKNDVLIQLADMVVSGYSRPFNRGDRSDAFRWRNMIERKVENIWNFS